MLAPTLVTLTGASDDVDVKELVDLSLEFPFVEWGILYSHKLSGVEQKYPSRQWIKKFFDTVNMTGYSNPMNVALHLCGNVIDDYINDTLFTVNPSSKNNINIVEFMHPYFILENFRLQLNFTLPHIGVDIEDIEAVISGELFPIITQHKPANTILLEYGFPSNHQLLFDTSGGRGITPTEWPEQIPEKMCGYAGGIGPDNIKDVLSAISNIAVTPYWIDMEAKLRTNDKFDLDKCRYILNIVKEFQNSKLL